MFPNFTFSFANISENLFVFCHWLKIFNFLPISLFQYMYISPYFVKIAISPYFYTFPSDFVKFTCFLIVYVFFVFHSFTMLRLCITQCTYWTPLSLSTRIVLSPRLFAYFHIMRVVGLHKISSVGRPIRTFIHPSLIFTRTFPPGQLPRTFPPFFIYPLRCWQW